MDELIKEALKEAELELGRETLNLLLSRIFYDLSLTNENLRDFELPEVITEIDLSPLSEAEKRVLYYQFADLLGTLLNEEVKHELLKRVNTLNYA
ncbi:hypothetical protein [Aquifex sp.]